MLGGSLRETQDNSTSDGVVFAKRLGRGRSLLMDTVCEKEVKRC